MINIAVLASGNGSNAENLIQYFRNNSVAEVKVVATNNPKAGVIGRAGSLEVPVLVFDRKDLNSGMVTGKLMESDIDLIVLAGFLWLIPENMITAFPDRIINIHPALLPRYGGKGMYGQHVHEAVIANHEKESGITIHKVDEKYDEGDVLFQAVTKVFPEDTPDSLANKIHELEYKHFPVIVEKYAISLKA